MHGPKLLEAGKTIPFPEVFVVKARAGNKNQKKKGAKSGPKTEAKLLGGRVISLTKVDDPRGHPSAVSVTDPVSSAGDRLLVPVPIGR